jgi:predicted transcriptional regulator
MKVDVSQEAVPLFAALGSKTRVVIIQLLAEKPANVKEMAATLHLSNPVVAKHVDVLENAGLIKTERIPGRAGLQKRCTLIVESLEVAFPKKAIVPYGTYHSSLPIGQYTNFKVTPPCGLVSTTHIIGEFDDPKFFMDPERFSASLIWFTSGYVEYTIMNPLKDGQHLKIVDISMELGSEFPGGNNNWPSDLTFFLNGTSLGQWTSPGDFIDKRGKYNPDWYSSGVNQYGTHVNLRITDMGCWINGHATSYNTFAKLRLLTAPLWTFRVAAPRDADHAGGCTLYGKGFGNYDQNIEFNFSYTPAP